MFLLLIENELSGLNIFFTIEKRKTFRKLFTLLATAHSFYLFTLARINLLTNCFIPFPKCLDCTINMFQKFNKIYVPSNIIFKDV